MSYYFSSANIPSTLSDPIFGLEEGFRKDPRIEKVNLIVGVYKDEDLQTPILSCVKQAERILLEKEETKNYLPIEGDPLFLKEVTESIFPECQEEAVFASFQVPGGTGGLRLGGEILYILGQRDIYLPNFSWPNHQGVFSRCGYQIKSYPYYDPAQKDVTFTAMMEFLETLPEQSLILFHVCCHNPTGADLSRSQWEEVAALCEKNHLIAFFDAAYLGFDRGFQEDCYPLQLFLKKGLDFLVSISFSKTFSLYAERVGALCIHVGSKALHSVFSLGKQLARRMYSNPPMHGAKILTEIFCSPPLYALWESELACMKERIQRMRELLVYELLVRGDEEDSALSKGKGLFSLLSLDVDQCKRLPIEHGVYLTEGGRINVAGLTEKTIPLVAQALVAVRKKK